MATYFPCGASTVLPWGSCIYTQMLTAFETVLRRSLTDGVIADALALAQILGAMEIAVLAVWWVMSDETDQLMAHLFVTGVKIGVFAQLIRELVPMSMAFADGAIQVGVTLGGNQLTLAQFHDPGAIMFSGWQLLTPVFEYLANLGKLNWVWHLGTIGLYVFCAVGAWACVLWIGFNIFVGWIELLLVSTIGVAYLPFLLFEHTRFLTAGMFSTIAAAAIRMGVFAALLSLLFPVMASLQMTDPGDPGLDTVFALLGVLGSFAYITYRAQVIAARMSGVSSAFTGGGLLFMAAKTRVIASNIQPVRGR
jgi:type IV secretion system protein TrbL